MQTFRNFRKSYQYCYIGNKLLYKFDNRMWWDNDDYIYLYQFTFILIKHVYYIFYFFAYFIKNNHFKNLTILTKSLS